MGVWVWGPEATYAAWGQGMVGGREGLLKLVPELARETSSGPA